MLELFQSATPILSLLVLCTYWHTCRKRALTHQSRVADLIEGYLGSPDVSDADKDSIYHLYVFFRKWWSLPILTVWVPFLMTLSIIKGKRPTNKKIKKEDRKAFEKREIISKLLIMYIAKNPITSLLCMLCISACSVALAVLGATLNRLSSMPTIDAIFGMYSAHTIMHRHHH